MGCHRRCRRDCLAGGVAMTVPGWEIEATRRAERWADRLVPANHPRRTEHVALCRAQLLAFGEWVCGHHQPVRNRVTPAAAVAAGEE